MTGVFSTDLERRLSRLMRENAPEQRLNAAEWAEQHRVMAQGSGALSGPFRFDVTPYLRGILERFSDPAVEEIWCQKSAQVGWTDGVINNIIGYLMDQDPCAIFMLFPKDAKATEFTREKLDPMIRANDRLLARVPLTSRDPGNTLNFKSFPGGFLKLTGSNSPDNVKSTSARVVIVEEPDDCNRHLKGQGNSIELARERCKTYPNRKLLIGGTPTIDGVSAIAIGMQDTDQRRYCVPCHDCGAFEPLRWEHVRWDKDETIADPVFGPYLPASARYICPACGSVWNEKDRAANITRGQWRATAPFRGRVGFYLSELVSLFAASRLNYLAEKFLKARKLQREGDSSSMISFWNNSLGLAWRLQSKTPAIEVLRDRCENYAQWTVPAGGWVCSIGVDVQHDRLAVTVKAWGRGEESWLVHAGEIVGSTMAEPHEGAWAELTRIIQTGIRSEAGLMIHAAAVGIDSSDGARSEAVYKYVRWAKEKLARHSVMAVKGGRENDRRQNMEIFSAPKTSVDVNYKGKAAKYGLRPYIVGTHKAKKLIMERLSLANRSGPGVLHFCRELRPDYFDQLTSEVEIPKGHGATEWQVKAGVRNEFLDCEVYALHAARRLRVHTLTENDWIYIEAQLRQRDLLTAAANAERASSSESPVLSPEKTAAPMTRAPARRGSQDFSL